MPFFLLNIDIFWIREIVQGLNKSPSLNPSTIMVPQIPARVSMKRAKEREKGKKKKRAREKEREEGR